MIQGINKLFDFFKQIYNVDTKADIQMYLRLSFIIESHLLMRIRRINQAIHQNVEINYTFSTYLPIYRKGKKQILC